MLTQFTSWFLSFWGKTFDSAWTFTTDKAIEIFHAIGGAFIDAVGSLTMPTFITGGLQTMYGSLPPGVAYFASAVGLPECLALVGLGFAFRMVRKFATLFQW